MKVGITLWVGILTAVLGFQTLVWAQDTRPSPCSQAYSEWQEVFGNLNQDMESLARLKHESLAQSISGDLAARKTSSTIAQIVRRVTAQHNRAITELGEECLRLANSEKIAFEQWRRCRISETRGRDDHSAVGLVRERSVKLVELQDLLLDDAYLQYRKESPNPSSAYSQSQDPRQSPGPDRRIGAGPYDPYYGMQ